MVPETYSTNIPYKTKEASAKSNRTTSPGRRRTTTYSTDAITRREALLVSEAFLCPSQTCFACLLSKGFRTWLLCQSWRLSEGGGRGGGLGMTREACNGCKTRRERRRRRRRGFLRKTTVLETPAKKAANQTVLVVFLPSLERKSTLLFLSLSTFSSERL